MRKRLPPLRSQLRSPLAGWCTGRGSRLDGDGHVVAGNLAVRIRRLVAHMVRPGVVSTRLVKHNLDWSLELWTARNLVGRQHGLADDQGTALRGLGDANGRRRRRGAILIGRGVVAQLYRLARSNLDARVVRRLGERSRGQGAGNGARKRNRCSGAWPAWSSSFLRCCAAG